MKDIWVCYVVLWIIDQYTLFGRHGLWNLVFLSKQQAERMTSNVVSLVKSLLALGLHKGLL